MNDHCLYSVEQPPWGRNDRFPDQLAPTTQTTDLVLKDPGWVVCDGGQGNPYDLSLYTWEAITFCTLLDRTPQGQRESVLAGMKQCIEDEGFEVVEPSDESARELVAA